MLPLVCNEIELSYTRAIACSYFLGAEVVMPDEPPLVRQSTLSRTLRAHRHKGAIRRRLETFRLSALKTSWIYKRRNTIVRTP
jgi:hypothetical protein